MTGYCDCKCRDCFEVAMTDSEGNIDYCHTCEAAGCDDGECQSMWPQEEQSNEVS